MKNTEKGLIVGSVASVLAVTALLVHADGSDPDPASFAIDMDAAKVVALTEVPGAVVEAELEDEDGMVVWEFEIVATDGTRMELLIDANSGELVSSERDDDDH